MGGTAYETESERLRREGGEEMQAKMQQAIILYLCQILKDVKENGVRSHRFSYGCGRF